MATKRLQKELKEFKTNPSSMGSADIVNDNLYHWIGVLFGPSDTPYANGIFKIEFRIPEDYPFKPPKVRFITRIYHPNIDSNGNVCLDLLKNKWSPALTIERLIVSIASLLNEPNPEDPLEPEIAFIYEKDRKKYDENARRYTLVYANGN